ncbi:MAG: MFS transporter [Planctomycetota bacterium]|nr:MFS transporter [Planctomycetota bacterium]
MARLLALYRDAFRGLPREVWLLSFCLFLNRCGTMAMSFLILFLIEEHGYATSEAGVVLTLFGVGGMGGIFVGGHLVDRIGFRPVQVGSLLLVGLGFTLFPALETRASIGAGALALGLVGEAFRPANGAAISAYSTPEIRLRAFGLNRLALNLGFTVGPAVGGVLAEINFDLLFWVDGITCAAAGIGLALLMPKVAPVESEEERARPTRSPWRDGLFLWVLLMMVLQGLVFFQVMSTYPLQLADGFGFTKAMIGGILALNAVIVVAVEMPLVRLFEHRSPMRIMALSGLLVGLGFGLLPLFDSLAWVMVLVFVWTVGEMLMAPMSMAWVANRATGPTRGAYMAAFGMSFSFCAAAAPLLGTRTLEHFGPNVLWGSCVVLGVAVFLGLSAVARSGRPA